MNKKQFIFLDLDGVVSSTRKVIMNLSKEKPRRGVQKRYNSLNTWIDDDAVYLLAWTLNSKLPDAKVVIISSWRGTESAVDISDIFARHGLASDRIIVPPLVPAQSKEEEIREIMRAGDIKPKEMAILDDNIEVGNLSDRVVKTNSASGLTVPDAHAVETLLNG